MNAINPRFIKIKRLQKQDIKALEFFPPKHWNFNIVEFMEKHHEKDYFYAVVAKFEYHVAGVANLIVNGSSAWIGNVIVNKEFRGNGIGNMLIKKIIDYCYNRDLLSILLIASPEVEKIYKGLGFRRSEEYIYLRGNLSNPVNSDRIRDMKKEDLQEVLKLDFEVSGENRIAILQEYLSNGFVYEENNQVEGYFLPDLEEGSIIARNEEAGLNLLHFKHSSKECVSVIPSSNYKAINFLLENEFDHFSSGLRMFMGKEVLWQPKNIYSRISGFMG